VENIEGYLGKPVNDPYGRRIGYLMGFFSDSDGNVTSLEIAIGDVEFREVSIDRFVFENDHVVLIPEWEYEARMVEERLERLRKRLVALNELYAKKEIPKHAYEEFKKKADEELLKTKEEAQNVREKLREKLKTLDAMIVELEKTMTSLKMSFSAAEISEKAYKVSADMIRKYIEIFLAEKESVKKHLELLEKLEKQPIDVWSSAESVQSTQKPTPETQPIPVVVLET